LKDDVIDFLGHLQHARLNTAAISLEIDDRLDSMPTDPRGITLLGRLLE
jgi:hypothetical protein